MRYENKTQINQIEWHYFINGEFNSIQNLDMRMFFPQELDSYLEWNGFSIIHKYGGFEEEVFNDNSGKQVFVCQYKSSLRIFVNCLHRTGFDTDTAVSTARTDILFKLIFHYLFDRPIALCIYIFHIMVCVQAGYNYEKAFQNTVQVCKHIYPDQILIGNSCLHLAFFFLDFTEITFISRES
mgnify:CR=1 FL=1